MKIFFNFLISAIGILLFMRSKTAETLGFLGTHCVKSVKIGTFRGPIWRSKWKEI